ncbi:unnamed protein product [Vitrella brassicaformis CCMP3155]|uniref:T6SS Phospholipase effector Tle1-like catalytic domain-containing protein n=1 Tax=Vitrella brassicaformis (strain CCMP3155) TaxID=1169540 RepID=A0A0G4H4L9_VITBC|nr:unnamed protein product [Vitrella brassicaformis CCMP3155]|eukprot:CEM38731.1 unnamed protein product [Vitrella brassicaformis CCMP3155]
MTMTTLTFCSAFLLALRLGAASSIICQEADCQFFVSAEQSVQRSSAARHHNVIVLFDGSGRNRDKERPEEYSNIALLADTIHQGGHTGGVEEVVKYFPGVGTERVAELSERFVETDKKLGGQKWWAGVRDSVAFLTGAGFTSNVLNAVSWLMEIGLTKHDQLFIFGFSRGALQAGCFKASSSPLACLLTERS